MTEPREKKSHLWDQNEHHWYVEDKSCTNALLRVEKFLGPVWDGCCGQGNIVEACLSRGIDAVGTDVVDRTNDAKWFAGIYDFINGDGYQLSISAKPFSIVTNPPFFRAKGTEQATRRALDLAKHKVCIFTDVKFLTGSGRAKGLYSERPPHRIWYLSPRPSCPPGEYLKAGNKAGGGTADYCWIVWDLMSPVNGTQAGWLRILPEDRT